ncbi:LolA family protein [Pseudooceanicola marinus]|uniref:LolA family protein n=1 Tax=Pseudooceanicola marinus TaxID=396013 RepID=UPI001CD34F52|nr:outer membrane lipoprotein carrier protein LolA [Pseudooceanicola marinus]MCA1335546.1 outer membrane lipoprotein carrier protein LolA [Pseudooceanicola marinus]
MKLMTRLLAPAAAILATALPALADPIPLPELSAYMNGMKTAEAKFTQVNGDGSISTGQLYIMRPGRMRFEYDPPNEALVMAGGNAVAVFDPKSNGGPETYSLGMTPLKLILDDRIDLGRDNMVTDYREEGPSTIVRAQDPEHPEYGHIELIFTGDPVELRQWVVTDEAGSQTTVILGELETGVSLGTGMFSIRQEMARRGG